MPVANHFGFTFSAFQNDGAIFYQDDIAATYYQSRRSLFSPDMLQVIIDAHRFLFNDEIKPGLPIMVVTSGSRLRNVCSSLVEAGEWDKNPDVILLGKFCEKLVAHIAGESIKGVDLAFVMGDYTLLSVHVPVKHEETEAGQ